MQITKTTKLNEQVGEHKLYKVNNVKNYEYKICESEINLELHEGQIENPIYYYCIDNPGSTAFAHWIYESFIFYSIIKELTKEIPNLKLITSNNKKYVKNFLKFVDINNEVILKNDMKPNNTMYFNPLLSLNDLNLDIELFRKYVLNYRNYCYQKINKSLKYRTYFIRSSVENYIPNDRILKFQNKLINLLAEKNFNVYDTYELDNVDMQNEILLNSEIFVCDYGSNFYVNGLLLPEGSTIHVIDSYLIWNGQKHYPAWQELIKICDENKIKMYMHLTDNLESICNNII